jgi:hypothetical protein
MQRLPLPRRSRFFARGLGLAILTFCAPAQAGEPTSWSCGPVEESTIRIDGLVSDWDGVSPTIMKVDAAVGSAARTLGVKLRCNFDDKNVYLLVEVDDDVVLRSGGAPMTEDHLELDFGIQEKKAGASRIDRLFVFPGSGPKQKRVVRWQAQRPPKVIEGEGPAGRKKGKEGAAFEIFDTLQPRGYAVELSMPKKVIPGYQEGAPLRLNVRVVDSDAPSGQQAASAELSPSVSVDDLAVLEFEQGQASLEDLLGELKLSAADIFFDKTADLGDGAGRVLMVGKFLAFSGKNYAFSEMAPQRADIKDVRLIDLGAKQQAVALRISERGSGGGREILRVFVMSGGRFQSIFAAELQKEQGSGRKLTTQVSYERRGAATEIVITPQPAVGFSAASYNEVPAEDVTPILLPWQDKKTRYSYKAGKYTKE